MTRNVEFDFSFESDLDEFDPLQDDAEDTEEDDDFGESLPASANTAAQTEESPAVEQAPEKPAEERTAELLKSMNSQRKTLMGILSFCLERQTVADVNEKIEELKKYNYSVYSAANLCSLLERAGAIERITAEGQDAEDIETEPRIVVVDGVEYLEAADAPETYWETTDAGKAALDADKPLERLHELLDTDGAYGVIYKRVLTMCAQEGGATTKSLGDAIDKDPMVQKPRYYATRFVDRLEKCDALEWRGAWYTTEIGNTALELLADVEDTFVLEAPEAESAQSTESAESSAPEAAETENTNETKEEA